MTIRHVPASLRARFHARRTKDLIIVAWEMVDRGMDRARVLATLVQAEVEAKKLEEAVKEVRT